MSELLLIALAVACLLLALALVFALRRGGGEPLRELRGAVENAASQTRIETGARLSDLQTALLAQVAQLGSGQTQQLASFGQQVARISELTDANARANREESATLLREFGGGMQQQLADLNRAIQLNLAEVRGTLNAQLRDMQQGNEAKLEQMRATVEEKLQTTLEARLGESFRLVSERLEQVHRGLGEMQALAQGVGDLKKVLGNVKTRGAFGELQLAALLEQMLTADQYAANVATRPGSREAVEFAVRMPGGGDGATVWLPIDAKFPTEDYERLLAAHELADRAAVAVATAALERRIRLEAQTIRSKYVEPPYTTDFAILFLPTEGLFAEVLRCPGLSDALHRDLRVVIAGPTTLCAMLNALQMGFRTLALQRRSAEVWQVLGAVKTEFGKFGEVLSRLKTQLASASNTIDQAETRTRVMTRALREIEALPVDEAQRRLPSFGLEEERPIGQNGPRP
jgi:DNA recombination protein RmuC